MSKTKTSAFTVRFDGRANILKTPVHIGAAFDHTKTTVSSITHRTYNGLWDTGASSTVITAKAARECGLKPIAVTNVETAGGTQQSKVYLVSIGLPNGVGISSLRVVEGILNGDFEVLIGMDVIGEGDFAITNKGGRTVFSYQSPSIKVIDFVAEANRQKPITKKKKPKRKRGKRN